VAIFRKKTPNTAEENGKPDKDKSEFKPQPEKARVWFQHGKTAADSYNYEYALNCYANGIKLDPDSAPAHDAMWEIAIQYNNNGGKPASGREIKAIDDSNPVAKFAAAEFAWMKDIANAALALKTLDAAVKAEQLEFGHTIAQRVLNLGLRSRKVTKAGLLQLMDLFMKVGAWNEAMASAEGAQRLDPTDAELGAKIKNISAQRAMDQGGYEAGAGKEGGFRASIRDADRQKELEEEESIAGGQSIDERNLARAAKAYEETPTAPDVINQFAQLLKKEGTPEDEQRAYDIYAKGFKDTGEYRFRMAAGDILIDQHRRRIKGLEAQLEEKPDDAELSAARDATRSEMLDLQTNEYTERVAKYPTNRMLKYDLGLVQFELGDYDSAMAMFQEAKDEPKVRMSSSHMLGRCFAKEQWHIEAIQEFKEALEAIDATQRDHELPMRYDLMLSLIAHARGERDLDLAKEARDISSVIARKQIAYKDIRAKRKEIEELIKELGAEQGSGVRDQGSG
jgi:tetratricopeptide (TPR) repeat protein